MSKKSENATKIKAKGNNCTKLTNERTMQLDQFYIGNPNFTLNGSAQAAPLKAGLHRNTNTNAACENDAYVHVGKFVDCSAFAEAANRPCINILYANSL